VQQSWAGSTCKFTDVEFSTVNGELDGITNSAGRGLIGAITAEYSGPISGYSNGRYEVVWQAPSLVAGGQQYNVRYSTSSMKVNGFASGVDGGSVRGPDGSDYMTTVWHSPNMAQAQTMYVAIQPSGQSAFAEVQIPAAGGLTATPPPTTQNACDVNNDGTVNNTDVQAAINQALSLSACTVDLNGDGVCDVVDVQRVINASMGQTCRVGQ
jgi:hypothetical protein